MPAVRDAIFGVAVTASRRYPAVRGIPERLVRYVLSQENAIAGAGPCRLPAEMTRLTRPA